VWHPLQRPSPLDTITVCPPGPMAHLNHPFEILRTYAGSFTWQPLVRFSRGIVLSLLRRIAIGQIVVRDSDGAVTICGAPQVKDGTPRSELRVLKETFWVRALLFADMVSIVPWHPGARSCWEVSPREPTDGMKPRALLRASCLASSPVRTWSPSSR